MKKNKELVNCEWHNGSDLEHPVTDNRCWNDCPEGQIWLTSNGEGKCSSSGASSYCCDGTNYTETDHLSDNLQKLKDEPSDWLANAKCELHLVKKSGGLEAHEDICEIVAKHSLAVKLAAIFAGYLNFSSRKSHYYLLANIWNMLADPFEHLSTKFMLPWITSNDTYPELPQQDYGFIAIHILQSLEDYSKLIAKSKDTIFCTLDLCEYRDGIYVVRMRAIWISNAVTPIGHKRWTMDDSIKF